MALGKNIKHHRERLGLTLEQLSDRSGVDLGTIHALEARDSSRSKYATAIARGLGMSVELLEIDTQNHVVNEPEAEDSGAVEPQAAYPHEARLLADNSALENTSKPRFLDDQLADPSLYAYPLVTFDELRKGVRVDRENNEFMTGRKTDVCDRVPGRHDFTIRTQDDSMNGGPRPIPAGTLVFIEATDEAAPGEIVLIQISDGTPVLRQLVEDGDGFQLLPSAPGMQGRRLPEGSRLLGVAFSWNVKASATSAGRKKLT